MDYFTPNERKGKERQKEASPSSRGSSFNETNAYVPTTPERMGLGEFQRFNCIHNGDIKTKIIPTHSSRDFTVHKVLDAAPSPLVELRGKRIRLPESADDHYDEKRLKTNHNLRESRLESEADLKEMMNTKENKSNNGSQKMCSNEIMSSLSSSVNIIPPHQKQRKLRRSDRSLKVAKFQIEATNKVRFNDDLKQNKSPPKCRDLAHGENSDLKCCVCQNKIGASPNPLPKLPVIKIKKDPFVEKQVSAYQAKELLKSTLAKLFYTGPTSPGPQDNGRHYEVYLPEFGPEHLKKAGAPNPTTVSSPISAPLLPKFFPASSVVSLASSPSMLTTSTILPIPISTLATATTMSSSTSIPEFLGNAKTPENSNVPTTTNLPQPASASPSPGGLFSGLKPNISFGTSAPVNFSSTSAQVASSLTPSKPPTTVAPVNLNSATTSAKGFQFNSTPVSTLSVQPMPTTNLASSTPSAPVNVMGSDSSKQPTFNVPSNLFSTGTAANFSTTGVTQSQPSFSSSLAQNVAPFGATTLATPFGASTTTAVNSLPFGTSTTANVNATLFGTATTANVNATPFGTPTTSNVNATPFGTSTTANVNTTPFGTSATANVNATPFGTSTTANVNATPFGTATTANVNATPFGTPTTTTHVNPTSFGAPTTSVLNSVQFGTTTSGSGNVAPFGAPTTSVLNTGAFGQGTTNANTPSFGVSTTANVNSTPFGASTTSAMNNAPFGASTSSGVQNPPTFGASASGMATRLPSFGSAITQSPSTMFDPSQAGKGLNIFGQSTTGGQNMPTFGASTSGNQNVPTFTAPSSISKNPPIFGNTDTNLQKVPTFGSTTTSVPPSLPTFGAPSNQKALIFGGPSTSGLQNPPAFGSTATTQSQPTFTLPNLTPTFNFSSGQIPKFGSTNPAPEVQKSAAPGSPSLFSAPTTKPGGFAFNLNASNAPAFGTNSAPIFGQANNAASSNNSFIAGGGNIAGVNVSNSFAQSSISSGSVFGSAPTANSTPVFNFGANAAPPPAFGFNAAPPNPAKTFQFGQQTSVPAFRSSPAPNFSNPSSTFQFSAVPQPASGQMFSIGSGGTSTRTGRDHRKRR